MQHHPECRNALNAAFKIAPTSDASLRRPFASGVLMLQQSPDCCAPQNGLFGRASQTLGSVTAKVVSKAGCHVASASQVQADLSRYAAPVLLPGCAELKAALREASRKLIYC